MMTKMMMMMSIMNIMNIQKESTPEVLGVSDSLKLE